MKYQLKYQWIALLSISFFSFIPVSFGADLGTPDRDDIEYPGDEEPSAELVSLGKILFYDNRLSDNQSQSCATCHNPDLGFGEGMASGFGSTGNRLHRNTPHLYNLAWASLFMWDGRFATLEEQALGPIQAAGEMNMDLGKLSKRLAKVPGYKPLFKAAFGDTSITPKKIAQAIAAFERTLISDNSPFDRYMAGDKNAMIPAAVRGMKLFTDKANCTACHDGVNFTDDSFHNIGIKGDDAGRMAIQKAPTNQGAFKTPGLRNTLLTAPYMHDGSLASLEDVIRHYNKGGDAVKGKSPLMKPLGLTDAEIFDLIAFLGALTDPIEVERPEIP